MSDQTVHIDWYSFTIPTLNFGSGDEMRADYARRLYLWIAEFAGDAAAEMFEADGWEFTSGRRPYNGGYRNSELGIYCWFGSQQTILVEMSGAGCQAARMRNAWNDGIGGNALSEIISASHERATRIDFAVDIRTPTRPLEFVGAGYNARIKSSGYVKSQSGETCYVGSKKAKSKYARVYRYDDDAHASRRDYLRIEMVAMKDHAKTHAMLASRYSVAWAAQSLANYFQWGSREMTKIEEHNEVYAPPARTSSDDKRVAWLKFQVAPAARDLVARGVITMEDIAAWFQSDAFQLKLPLHDD